MRALTLENSENKKRDIRLLSNRKNSGLESSFALPHAMLQFLVFWGIKNNPQLTHLDITLLDSVHTTEEDPQAGGKELAMFYHRDEIT